MIKNLIAGLTLVSEAINGAGFYNSAERASFTLNRSLTKEEQQKLKDLGFDYAEKEYESGFIFRGISFEGW